MALKTTSTVLGSQTVYELSPAVKKYTLRDVGFVPTNKGNFQLEYPLDANSPFNVALKLKITVGSDLKQFKMAVTSPDGLRAVDIFTKSKNPEQVEQFNFMIERLIERQVLVEK